MSHVIKPSAGPCSLTNSNFLPPPKNVCHINEGEKDQLFKMFQ